MKVVSLIREIREAQREVFGRRHGPHAQHDGGLDELTASPFDLAGSLICP